MEHFMSGEQPDAQTIEDALLDFGFYHEFSSVARMYAELTNHHHYGYEGGVLDQPDAYWQDMDTMRWLSHWVKYVKPAPQLEHVSVFDTLKKEDRFNGKWINGGNS